MTIIRSRNLWGVCGKLYDCQLIKDKHLHFDEDMVYSENRVFNIEYYSHVKYYGIASDSIYTCDYVPDQAVSHLSFTRTEKAFASEIRKIEREQAFLSNRKIYRSAEVISAFIASAMISFCIIEEKDISYHSF